MSTSDGVGAQVPARDRPAQPGWRPGGDLTPLEEEMVAGAAAGELVDRGEGPFTLAEMQAWAEERTVRAAVLRHLLIAGQWPVDAKGVRLRGVRISGLLDLEAAALRCPLWLDCCYLDADEPVCLDYATASRLTLTGCQLAGLTGEMLTARALDLSRSTLSALLRLADADITGPLSCSGAQLTGSDDDGNALVADGIKVGGGVFLDDGFTAAGAVRLSRRGHHRPAQLQRRPADRHRQRRRRAGRRRDEGRRRRVPRRRVHRRRGGPAARRGHHRPAQLQRRPADRQRQRRRRAGRRRDEGRRRGVPRRRVHRRRGGPAARRGHHRPAQLQRRPADRYRTTTATRWSPTG